MNYGWVLLDLITVVLTYSGAGYFLAPPTSRPEIRLIVGAGLCLLLHALGTLVCFWIKAPVAFVLVIPLLGVLARYATSPKTFLEDARAFPAELLFLHLLIAFILVLQSTGYPLIDNSMRAADWTSYFLEADRLAGGSGIRGFVDASAGLSGRPAFFPAAIAPWMAVIGNDLWVFQLVATGMNSLFFVALWVLVASVVESRRMGALIFLFLVLHAGQSFFLTNLWPKHVAAFLILAAFLTMDRARNDRNITKAGAALAAASYFFHQSGFFYWPVLAYYLLRFIPNRRRQTAFLFSFLLIVFLGLAHQVKSYGWREGLSGSPTVGANKAHGFDQQMVKWAMNVGGSFLPVGPFYTLFRDESYPRTFAGIGTRFLLYFPTHAMDAWYLSADLAGLLVAGMLFWKARRKLKAPVDWIVKTWRSDAFFPFVALSFLLVTLGIFFNPYYGYGGNHTIGLLAMTAVAIWIWKSGGEAGKKILYFGLAVSLLEHLLEAWLTPALAIYSFHHPGSVIARSFGALPREIALRNSFLYLYDLWPWGGMRLLAVGLFLDFLLIGACLYRAGFKLKTKTRKARS